MRKKINTTAAIFPMPVLIIATYNDDNSVNAMNAAWGTMIEMDIIGLNLSETHKTFENIKKRKAFTVSLADARHVKEADYFGVVSGNKIGNKVEKTGLKVSKSSLVDAPIIEDFPICMECELIETRSGANDITVIGKIINVSVLEEYIRDGKLDIDALKTIAYDPFTHGYYLVSQRVGNAFKDGLKIK